MNHPDEERRRRDRDCVRALGVRVTAWDPIGLIAIGAPPDEYDRLIGPITSGLRQGVTSDGLAAALDRFIPRRLRS